jgi:hypothetical protein
MQRNRPLHVEVAVDGMCPTPLEVLKTQWEEVLKSTTPRLADDRQTMDLSNLSQELQKACWRARIVDDYETDNGWPKPSLETASFVVDPFILSQEEPSVEELAPTGGDDEWTAACDSLPLPHISLDGLWDNLIYDSETKQTLLDYAQSAMLFADRSVSSHVVHFNRMVLLHGPPGTGKTSLCRALAHKLAIRMSLRFPRCKLLEIHSHSLFSKWFSTSGKLVSALFQMVRDMLSEDPSAFLCVLIDEVESLASSRNTASSGDPSDAMRAVNSLLTSLDRLRSFPNVLVLATTNLTGAVDEAFVDRVDLKIHIGMPILKARYQILRSCVEELARVGIIEQSSFLVPSFDEKDSNGLGAQLNACAAKAEGLSGRSLRRLPLQAHARFLHGATGVPTRGFLLAMEEAIAEEQMSRNKMIS